MNGWIKLHRKLLENQIHDSPLWGWLWVNILLLANHSKDEKFIWNGKAVVLKEGQFITGRKKLSEQTGVSESSIERGLNYFQNEQQIEQQKTTKYRLITILNWTKYQIVDSNMDNRRTTDGQQTDTFKKNKKNKNDNKTPTEQSSEVKEVNFLISLFKEVNPTYEQLFRRPNQYAAAKRMLEKFGREQFERMIRYLPQSNAIEFCPKATTPIQLEDKMGNIRAFLLSKQKKWNNVI